MIELMEGVEDIPGTALYEGMSGAVGRHSLSTSSISALENTPLISAPKSRTAPFGTTSWASERFGTKMQPPRTYPPWQPLCKVR